HHPDVSVLTGAPRRTISEAVVMIGKNPARIARLAVSEQGHLAVSKVIAIVLKPLAATDVFAKNKVIAVRPVMRASRPVGEKGELSPRASRHLHQMDLRDVGKPSRDQHFSPNRIPIQQGSGTKLAILICFVCNGRGNRRDIFDYQVVTWTDDRRWHRSRSRLRTDSGILRKRRQRG